MTLTTPGNRRRVLRRCWLLFGLTAVSVCVCVCVCVWCVPGVVLCILVGVVVRRVVHEVVGPLRRRVCGLPAHIRSVLCWWLHVNITVAGRSGVLRHRRVVVRRSRRTGGSICFLINCACIVDVPVRHSGIRVRRSPCVVASLRKVKMPSN